MNDDIRREIDRIHREYGMQGPDPKRWPRNNWGVLLKIPTPELEPIWLKALQDLSILCKRKPMVICQGTGCHAAMIAWDHNIDGQHLCHVCKVTGGLK